MTRSERRGIARDYIFLRQDAVYPGEFDGFSVRGNRCVFHTPGKRRPQCSQLARVRCLGFPVCRKHQAVLLKLTSKTRPAATTTRELAQA